MADKFQYQSPTLISPGTAFVALTPSDSTDIATKPRALYVGVGGSIAVIDELGVTTTFLNVGAGTFLPIRPVRLMATNTTATSIIGCI